jgi:CHAT domain/NB-ARC domain
MTGGDTEAVGKVAFSREELSGKMTLATANTNPSEINFSLGFGSRSRFAENRLSAPLNTLRDEPFAFTGRMKQREEIETSLEIHKSVYNTVSLKGISGIGKTALAIMASRKLSHQYKSAQLWIDMYGKSDKPRRARDVMKDVIGRFYEIDVNIDDDKLSEIYRKILRDNEILLVFDDVRDALQVSPLIPPRPSASIITSRQAIKISGVKPMRIKELSLEDSVELLRTALVDGPSSFGEELEELARACLCHPHALVIAYLQAMHGEEDSLIDLANRIEEDPSTLTVGNNLEYDLLGNIGQSIELLRKQDQALFVKWIKIVDIGREFDAGAASKKWLGISVGQVRRELNTLDDLGLVEKLGALYTVHPFIRSCVKTSLMQTDEMTTSESESARANLKVGSDMTSVPNNLIAVGAGAVRIGGRVAASQIATHVERRLPEAHRRHDARFGTNRVKFVQDGAITVVGDVEGTTISTNVVIVQNSTNLEEAASVEFPQLSETVDLILRIEYSGSEVLRFDALDKNRRRDGPYWRHITKGENFASKLSELASKSGSEEGQAAANLRAIGMDIADCFPNELVGGPDSLLGGLMKTRGLIPSILILTDEAYVPWELAFLESANARPNGRAFLGQVAKVGRWPINQQNSGPRAALTIGDIHCFAAKSYARTASRKDLPHAVAEQNFLIANFDAIPHDAIESEFGKWLGSGQPNVEMLHIAVHGYSDPNANEQTLILGDGYGLTPEELVGIGSNGVPRNYSFVFINACQAGTGGQTLGQVAGFPGTLARRGAGGVVAPIWEVEDSEACEFAKNFYDKTLKDELGVGAALRSLRNDSSQLGIITRLAYVFFGHPLLKFKQGQSGTIDVE